jgi:hypothetical protein
MHRGPTRLHTVAKCEVQAAGILSARATRYDLRQHLVPQYDRCAYECGPEKSASQLLEGPAEYALSRKGLPSTKLR